MSIEIRNISKRFGNFVALDNINLDIPTGELVALLVPRQRICTPATATSVSSSSTTHSSAI